MKTVLATFKSRTCPNGRERVLLYLRIIKKLKLSKLDAYKIRRKLPVWKRYLEQFDPHARQWDDDYADYLVEDLEIILNNYAPKDYVFDFMRNPKNQNMWIFGWFKEEEDI